MAGGEYIEWVRDDGAPAVPEQRAADGALLQEAQPARPAWPKGAQVGFRFVLSNNMRKDFRRWAQKLYDLRVIEDGVDLANTLLNEDTATAVAARVIVGVRGDWEYFQDEAGEPLELSDDPLTRMQQIDDWPAEITAYVAERFQEATARDPLGRLAISAGKTRRASSRNSGG